MKKSYILMIILFTGLLAIAGCAQKNVEGTVISVPMSMSFNEMMSGEVSNMTFTGDLVTVRLESGEEVKALATHEQMEEAFEGKTHASLENLKDPEHEGVNWKIVTLKESPSREKE
ncbi:MAG: hypothetical protein RQ743_12600 [Bacteroidales bacterium]|nr:hypothetical protein [Bacteroidales bacterium]